MGLVVASECRICNYANTFKFGRNRFNYDSVCNVPAINIELNEFVNINLIDLKSNDKYKFYHEEELKGNNENNNVLEASRLELNTINNYCPNCQNFTFDFKIKTFTD